MLGIALGIIFGILPDFDVLLVLPDMIKRDKSLIKGTKFRHHGYPSHYPLLYSPLILVAVFFPNPITLTMVTALYLHFLGDTFCSSNGVKWLAPLSNRYVHFLNEKTQDKHGGYWTQAYQTTILYKLEFVLLAITLGILWWNHFYFYQIPTWGLYFIAISLTAFYIGGLFFERYRTRLFDELIAKAESEE
jgi:hypothetical protein